MCKLIKEISTKIGVGKAFRGSSHTLRCQLPKPGRDIPSITNRKVSTLLSQQEEDFLQSQQQSQSMENATVQSMRSCHPPSTFHQWTFIFLLLITSLPHHPVYKRLPFCITPPSTSLLARWDAACFMNHLIRPTRSSNLVSWILGFLNTGKVIEPNKVIMF